MDFREVGGEKLGLASNVLLSVCLGSSLFDLREGLGRARSPPREDPAELAEKGVRFALFLTSAIEEVGRLVRVLSGNELPPGKASGRARKKMKLARLAPAEKGRDGRAGRLEKRDDSRHGIESGFLEDFRMASRAASPASRQSLRHGPLAPREAGKERLPVEISEGCGRLGCGRLIEGPGSDSARAFALEGSFRPEDALSFSQKDRVRKPRNELADEPWSLVLGGRASETKGGDAAPLFLLAPFESGASERFGEVVWCFSGRGEPRNSFHETESRKLGLDRDEERPAHSIEVDEDSESAQELDRGDPLPGELLDHLGEDRLQDPCFHPLYTPREGLPPPSLDPFRKAS
jgi:hypothetical protein